MDIRLIRKDFLLIKRWLIPVFILFIFLPLILEIQINDSRMGWLPVPLLLCTFTYMLIGILYEKDERNTANYLLLSSTYNRRMLIKNRFYFIISLVCCYLIVCFLITLCIYPEEPKAALTGCSAGMLFSALIAGLMVPFLSKYHYVKAQNIMMIAFFGSVVLLTLGAKYGQSFFKIGGPIDRFTESPVFIWASIPVLCFAVLTISYAVSVRAFENKEFCA